MPRTLTRLPASCVPNNSGAAASAPSTPRSPPLPTSDRDLVTLRLPKYWPAATLMTGAAVVEEASIACWMLALGPRTLTVVAVPLIRAASRSVPPEVKLPPRLRSGASRDTLPLPIRTLPLTLMTCETRSRSNNVVPKNPLVARSMSSTTSMLLSAMTVMLEKTRESASSEAFR